MRITFEISHRQFVYSGFFLQVKRKNKTKQIILVLKKGLKLIEFNLSGIFRINEVLSNIAVSRNEVEVSRYAV